MSAETIANESAWSGQTQRRGPLPVTVIMTVKDDAAGCLATLGSLRKQTRQPDQVVVVDGGSKREALDALQAFTNEWPAIELAISPGANIAAGRNIATRAARHETIACIDAGCRAESTWLENLMAPFEQDDGVSFIAGNYKIEPHNLFEEVAGLATMRGQLDPLDPKSFNPSARSLAYCRDVWREAGGWPEWLRFSEDTLFDERVRKLGVKWAFAEKAIVHWRPRTSWRGLAKQFYNYGTGRGHTQMGQADFLYNMRNLSLSLILLVASLWSPWFLPLLAAQGIYHYVWAFHAKSIRIAKRCSRLRAYPLSLAVHWVVLLSHLAGFLHGSAQRLRNRSQYRERESYPCGELSQQWVNPRAGTST